MRFVRTLLCTVVLMFFAVPALAQTKNTSLFTLEDGYQFTLPSGWAQADWDGEGFLFENGDASILVLDPVLMESLVSLSSRSDVGEALISAYDSFYNDTLDDSDLEFITYGEYSAAQWFFEDQGDNEGVFITAEIARRTFIAFDIVAPAGERDDAIDAAKEMLFTLTQGEATTSTASGSSGTLTSTTSSTSSSVSTGEPCTISVSSANTAALRVGPGTNRTSVAFLPADVDFEVIGQATANDGSEWFKLDKAEAAPRSAANEIWVAADDVETVGDCSEVVDAIAPPVVPIINNPPPATPAPAGSSETTTTTTTNPGGATPLTGSWTLVFARQSSMNCAGYQGITVNTPEAWNNWTEADYSFSGQLFFSGSNIVFAGDTYRPTGTANEYVTNINFDNGQNTQIYITFTSPSTFRGQMNGNGVFDGLACSSTVGLSGRRG